MICAGRMTSAPLAHAGQCGGIGGMSGGGLAANLARMGIQNAPGASGWRHGAEAPEPVMT
ncbi:hypothetical protein GCM10011419_05770 [Vogesella fluminis]|uniref:Uncharacterized protein n=1 Tax=Vogesella fluminis TaxID=1069161 RepID=A0ABQ3H8H3_9NEIS|nr:hypothetical protein GCM10011419_05770 [Vogesella fluminis]